MLTLLFSSIEILAPSAVFFASSAKPDHDGKMGRGPSRILYGWH